MGDTRSRLLLTAVLLVMLGLGLYAGAVVKRQAGGQPVTLTRDLPQLEQALADSHWVSPGVAGDRALYMISFRSCPYCVQYETLEFPRLQKAGVDTRAILVARSDQNGVARSTPAERATVAELWRTRDWRLYQRWTEVPVDAWNASGEVPAAADSDPDRRAAVDAGRAAVARLAALLHENGVELHYPTLIWKTADGRWRSFVGYDATAAATIRTELGAS
jgi:hypothetical protein